MSTEKSAELKPWPWWLILAFVLGCAWAGLVQAARDLVSIVRRGL